MIAEASLKQDNNRVIFLLLILEGCLRGSSFLFLMLFLRKIEFLTWLTHHGAMDAYLHSVSCREAEKKNPRVNKPANLQSVSVQENFTYFDMNVIAILGVHWFLWTNLLLWQKDIFFNASLAGKVPRLCTYFGFSEVNINYKWYIQDQKYTHS